MTEINPDRRQLAVMHTAGMDWQPSPSPDVWRKRLELVGPEETGPVTSVVRYRAGGAFAEHGHPEGEEFLVLEGTFSDEHGDYPAGSFVLNPPGSRHTPFSREGCTLFVKLRQYAGEGRRQLAIDTRDGDWQRTGLPGQEVLPLYAQHGFPERMRLARLAPGTEIPPHEHPSGAEIFLLSGDFEDGTGAYRAGDWVRYPPGSRHGMATRRGCSYYLKTGHLVGAG
jgi:anti-sigma factor ChrR (cupin superfamily)